METQVELEVRRTIEIWKNSSKELRNEENEGNKTQPRSHPIVYVFQFLIKQVLWKHK